MGLMILLMMLIGLVSANRFEDANFKPGIIVDLNMHDMLKRSPFKNLLYNWVMNTISELPIPNTKFGHQGFIHDNSIYLQYPAPT